MAHKNENVIKEAIVDRYRCGICDYKGRTIPKDKRGMAGKGSHFGPASSEAYRRHYEQIKW